MLNNSLSDDVQINKMEANKRNVLFYQVMSFQLGSEGGLGVYGRIEYRPVVGRTSVIREAEVMGMWLREPPWSPCLPAKSFGIRPGCGRGVRLFPVLQKKSPAPSMEGTPSKCFSHNHSFVSQQPCTIYCSHLPDEETEAEK